MPTRNKQPAQNTAQKEGEGGYASGGVTLGSLIVIGGLFTSVVNPAVGIAMMIVASECEKLIEEHGRH